MYLLRQAMIGYMDEREVQGLFRCGMTRKIVMIGALGYKYDRTVLGFHGTKKKIAEDLISGKPFKLSKNDDDWLGRGIYFWEEAPMQAWWWAHRYFKEEAAVVGAVIRLGRCLDLLDPQNVAFVKGAERQMVQLIQETGDAPRQNARVYKYHDCEVFNFIYDLFETKETPFDSSRAIFATQVAGKGISRPWPKSGIIENAHIQISVRNTENIAAVWPVKKDGQYGKE